MKSTTLYLHLRMGVIALCALCLEGESCFANGNMDPDDNTAWSENAGWINFEPANGGVTVHYNGRDGHLSGYAWAENVGWIKLGHSSGGPYGNTSATDWGVNLEPNGRLTGHAWGENIGWVRFNPLYSQVTVDTATGRFSADAWGENIGWMRFEGVSPFYSVRTRAFDARPLGTPNWWLTMHGVAETTDTDGDGLLEWQEYIAGTIPTNAASLLAIVDLGSTPRRPLEGPATNRVYFNSVTNRLYKLEYVTNPLVPPWKQVPGQWGIPGNGGRMALVDIHATEERFYRIGVKTW
jgi:hypothetical protein